MLAKQAGRIFIALSLALLIAQFSFSLPVPGFDRADPQSHAMKQRPPENNKCPQGVCANKGRFCELLCKNNPSEGGKMCK